MALGENRSTGGNHNHKTAGVGRHARTVSKNFKTWGFRVVRVTLQLLFLIISVDDQFVRDQKELSEDNYDGREFDLHLPAVPKRQPVKATASGNPAKLLCVLVCNSVKTRHERGVHYLLNSMLGMVYPYPTLTQCEWNSLSTAPETWHVLSKVQHYHHYNCFYYY